MQDYSHRPVHKRRSSPHSGEPSSDSSLLGVSIAVGYLSCDSFQPQPNSDCAVNRSAIGGAGVI